MEFRGVSNFITQDMRQFVNGDVHEHVHRIVLLLLVLEAQVHLLFVQRVRFGVCIELEFLNPRTQQHEVFTDLVEDGIGLLVLFTTKRKGAVQDRQYKGGQEDGQRHPRSRRVWTARARTVSMPKRGGG